jgi:hypothetical protein
VSDELNATTYLLAEPENPSSASMYYESGQ